MGDWWDWTGDTIDTGSDYFGSDWGSGWDTDQWGGSGGWMDTALDIFGGGSGGDSGGGSWWDTALNWLGGDSGNGGTNGSNIFGAMLGGLGGAAEAYLGKDAVEEQGKQQRQTLDFTAAIDDYYNQLDKSRKRTALDTYGQFSLMDRWAPNATNTPPVQVPNKPSP